MVWVTSKRRKLQHHGLRGLGDRWQESDRVALELERKGLVTVERDEEPNRPAPPAGASVSASPAGQVSPAQTAKPSKRGRKKKPPAAS